MPAGPPIFGPLTSTYSVATMRQLVGAGARLDSDPVTDALRAGHPGRGRNARKMRQYLAELGVPLYPPMSGH